MTTENDENGKREWKTRTENEDDNGKRRRGQKMTMENDNKDNENVDGKPQQERRG